MTDREKVIKGLECCSSFDSVDLTCMVCPYTYDDDEAGEARCNRLRFVQDILALLKEQEAKSVITHENAYGRKFYYCPKCGREFYDYPPYPVCCDRCGQAVKWDD